MLDSNAAALAEAALGAGALPAELSVVDAVLWACDLSEDETEVGDLVDAALRRPGVRVVDDPALDDGPAGPGPGPLE